MIMASSRDLPRVPEPAGQLRLSAGPGHARLAYAAGRLGSGSDVLGFDDAMSRDHDWGCRLRELLERELPASYRGHPVRFPVTWDPSPGHKVEVATVAGFAVSRLGVDPADGPPAGRPPTR